MALPPPTPSPSSAGPREGSPGLCLWRAHCPNLGSLSIPAAARRLTPQPAPSGPPSLGRDGQLHGLSSPASHDLISPRPSQSLPDKGQALRSPGSGPTPPAAATWESRPAQPPAPLSGLPALGPQKCLGLSPPGAQGALPSPHLLPSCPGPWAMLSGEVEPQGPGAFSPFQMEGGSSMRGPWLWRGESLLVGRPWGRPRMDSWPFPMTWAILSPSLPRASCTDLCACWAEGWCVGVGARAQLGVCGRQIWVRGLNRAPGPPQS